MIMRGPLGMLLLLLAWGIMAPAQAQVLKCQSGHLGKQDEKRVLTLIRTLLPRGVELDGSPSECRNPGWAQVWVSTRHRPTGDGATEWWVQVCRRESRKWSCDRTEHHLEVDFDTTLSGINRHIKTQFGADVGVQRARELTVRAFQLLQDPGAVAPTHQCGREPQPETDAKEWEKLKIQFGLKPSDVEIAADVSFDESGTISVDLFDAGGPAVTFSVSPAEGQPVLDCWGIWVIVT